MALPDGRIQQLFEAKDQSEALRWCTKHRYDEYWSAIDGALVIYNGRNPPPWLKPVLESMDDDGYTPEFKGSMAEAAL